MSAPPSATRPNFTADPSLSRTAPGRPAMKASLRGSPCERLTATIQGSPRPGSLRVWIGSAAPREVVAHRQPIRAAADQPAPDQSERGGADDAEQRRPFGHQRQIDREFVAAGDEFLGAVERIDQKEAAAIGRPGLFDALLGQHRYLRGQPRQSLGNDPVGGEIGLGYRRAVQLAFDLHRGPVDGKNGGPGLDHEVGQGLHQISRGVAIDHGSHAHASWIGGFICSSSF